MKKEFIPVADDHKAWQARMMAVPALREFVLKCGVADQPSIEKRWRDVNWNERSTIIGIFALAPSGEPLDAVNKNPRPRDNGVLLMLQNALARYKDLKKEKRLLALDPPSPDPWRWEGLVPRTQLPARMMALSSYTRDLPRGAGDSAVGNYTRAWTKALVNFDTVWLEQTTPVLPDQPEVGQRYPLPPWFLHRLVRYHLLDTVMGRTTPFEESDIERARMDAVAERIEDGVAYFRIEGETRAAVKGTWAECETCLPARAERGFETDLYGWVAYDLTAKSLLQFDLVALGKRWGSTESNRRYDTEFEPITDDRAPSPIGVAFRLHEGPVENAVPPNAVWDYGVEYFTRGAD